MVFYEKGLSYPNFVEEGDFQWACKFKKTAGTGKNWSGMQYLQLWWASLKLPPLACVKQQKSLKWRSKVFSTTAVRKVRTNRKLLSVYCKGWIYKEQAIDYLLGYITQPICAILSPSCWLSAHSFNPLVVVDLCIMKKCFECNTDQIGHVRGAIITGCYTGV